MNSSFSRSNRPSEARLNPFIAGRYGKSEARANAARLALNADAPVQYSPSATYVTLVTYERQARIFHAWYFNVSLDLSLNINVWKSPEPVSSENDKRSDT